MAVLRPVILASSSETRRKILSDAGLAFEAVGTTLDEKRLKEELTAKGVAGDAFALALARAKATEIAEKHGDFLVIGADQILECGGKRFDKPQSRTQARRQLEGLSGKTHSLTSVVCVLCGEKMVWTYSDHAHLTMRSLSGDFMDFYLKELREKKLRRAGLYQLEGLGSQLFLSVEGDFFTILGLPLFPLLEFLRSRGIMKT
ncbi:MAG: Maf family protein [Alphaproteobacteria bacterium]|jgi:septum formation protein|nr:Maf family protein [Alphaproteobacteria bacterium]MDP6660726.1 Maf family protein [Alphaproteobacteria bacterium]MDP6780902.1 Maf family protein [Alphaproteobacteria bacterium]MDP7044581.1 Maf family protein [Alphaproteobacteria bacterium]HAQ32936.1 hypothetical protein [Rhodospirillaceae bacterium]